MPIYVVLTTLTDHGRKTIKDHPDRITEVNGEMEAMGVKILAQYSVLGKYDFVNVLDVASNQAMTKVAVQLGSRGTLQTLTLPAMPTDEFIASLKG